jgi:colanic acid/amylovoran biosynthesis protein
MVQSLKIMKRIAPDTSNMGVTALYMSTITGFSKYIDDLEFVVFDNGLGRREKRIEIYHGKNINIIRFGARSGLRYYRPENMLTMLIMSKLGKLGAILNEGIKLIDSCDVVLDVSGGDSFSDIYDMERFNIINRAKQLTVNRKKTLVLLSQTYGPYTKLQVRKKAAESVKNSSFAWARDNDSYKILQDLSGSQFSSHQRRCGVDMAFSLQKINAEQQISESPNDWLKKLASSESCVVGINVSGLIYNDPDKAKTTYRFKADYKKLVNDLVIRFLNNTKTNIVLISHVIAKPGHYESEAKWLTSKLDWFCGTRMHSAMTGLSSCVPTSTISYSHKAKGVFATCEQGKHVIDPRINDANEALYLLINSFNKMSKTKNHRSCSPYKKLQLVQIK